MFAGLMQRSILRSPAAAAAGGTWTPAQIVTAASVWLANAGPFTQSGTISQWNDTSGNANHAVQATSGNRPTYNATGGPNSNPEANFDGTDDKLGLTSGITYAGGTGLTVFVVAEQTGSASYRGMTGGTNGDSPQFRYDNDHKLSILRRNIEVVQTTAGTLATGWHVVGFEASTNLTKLWTDGTSAQQTSVNPAFTNVLDELGSGGAGSIPFVGGIAEIFIHNGLLSAGNIDKLAGYLAWQHNLVSLLPGGHPYKTSAP